MARFLAIVLLAYTIQLCNTQVPAGFIYERVDCLGPNIELPPHNPKINDLQAHNFSNHAHSVNIDGAFILYDLPNYNTAKDGRVEYYYTRDQTCINLLDTANRLSSIRYAGNIHNHTVDSITLYKQTYFQAEDEHVQTDRPSLFDIGSALSFVLTGSSAWTLYEQPFYLGNATCVQGSANKTAVFSPLLQLIPNNKVLEINSVRKGCIR